MKTAFVVVLKVVVLTAILFVCFAAAGRVVEQQTGTTMPEQAGNAAVALLVVCFLDTIVLTGHDYVCPLGVEKCAERLFSGAANRCISTVEVA